MAEERLPVVREMILADSEDGRRTALDRLLPMQQGDFEGIFEAMAGLPVTIRLLDPPLHEFLPPLEQATDERMRRASGSCRSRTRCSARAGAVSACSGRRSTRCRCGRSSGRRARSSERTGEAPLVEIMHPLVGFEEELRRLRELTVRVAEEEAPEVEYLCGTMIELPRACIRADEIAEHADFFSFGTNDLTQTALGFSRDDAEGKFLTHYLEDGVLEKNPFETLDVDGVGDLMRIAVERGRVDEARHQARHLRRARGRAEVGRVLPRARARLRLAARRTACRSRGSPPRRPRWPRAGRRRTRRRAADDGLRDPRRRRARRARRLRRRGARLARRSTARTTRRTIPQRRTCRFSSGAPCLAHRRQAHRPRAVLLAAHLGRGSRATTRAQLR